MPINESTLNHAAEIAATAITQDLGREGDAPFVARIIATVRSSFVRAESEAARRDSVEPMSTQEPPYVVGYVAGRLAVVPDSPYPPGCPAAQEWMIGYGAGVSRQSEAVPDRDRQTPDGIAIF